MEKNRVHNMEITESITTKLIFCLFLLYWWFLQVYFVEAKALIKFKCGKSRFNSGNILAIVCFHHDIFVFLFLITELSGQGPTNKPWTPNQKLISIPTIYPHKNWKIKNWNIGKIA